MIWRGQLDIPAELEDKLPRIVTETIVTLAGVAIAVGLRLALQRFVGDVVPFALTFPVLCVVILLAGLRAGLMTMAGCQLLIWYHVLPPRGSFAIEDATAVANLVLVTGAQLLLVFVMASYRDAARRLISTGQEEIADLSLALREIDHRTRNNFQLAIALLNLQARNSRHAEVKAGLENAAARLQAIASVYSNLAVTSASLEEIRLHEHLREICNRLREGLLPASIALKFEAVPIIARQDVAIRLGLILNELITNAAKHAFPDGLGSVHVVLADAGNGAIAVEIRDDGKGIEPDQGATGGLGGKLVTMLARQIDAQVAVSVNGGTIHRIHIPSPH